MLFQQLCCSGVGGYQQVQAHLWSRATTFYALPVPLPRQVFLCVHFGVQVWAKSCKYVAKKGVALEHCRTHVVSLRQSASRPLHGTPLWPFCLLRCLLLPRWRHCWHWSKKGKAKSNKYSNQKYAQNINGLIWVAYSAFAFGFLINIPVRWEGTWFCYFSWVTNMATISHVYGKRRFNTGSIL